MRQFIGNSCGFAGMPHVTDDEFNNMIVYKYWHIATWYKSMPDGHGILPHLNDPRHWRSPGYLLIKSECGQPGQMKNLHFNNVMFLHQGVRKELGGINGHDWWGEPFHGQSYITVDEQGAAHCQSVRFNWQGAHFPLRPVEITQTSTNIYVGRMNGHVLCLMIRDLQAPTDPRFRNMVRNARSVFNGNPDLACQLSRM